MANFTLTSKSYMITNFNTINLVSSSVLVIVRLLASYLACFNTDASVCTSTQRYMMCYRFTPWRFDLMQGLDSFTELVKRKL